MAFQRLARRKAHCLELEVGLLAGCAHKKKEEPFGFSFFLVLDGATFWLTGTPAQVPTMK
jgi:hypothetical protein